MNYLYNKIKKAYNKIKRYTEEIDDEIEYEDKTNKEMAEVLESYLRKYPEIKELSFYNSSGTFRLLIDFDCPELATYPEHEFVYKQFYKDIDEETGEKIIYSYNSYEEQNKRTYNKKYIDLLFKNNIKKPFIKSLMYFANLLYKIDTGDFDFLMKTVKRKNKNEI